MTPRKSRRLGCKYQQTLRIIYQAINLFLYHLWKSFASNIYVHLVICLTIFIAILLFSLLEKKPIHSGLYIINETIYRFYLCLDSITSQLCCDLKVEWWFLFRFSHITQKKVFLKQIFLSALEIDEFSISLVGVFVCAILFHQFFSNLKSFISMFLSIFIWFVFLSQVNRLTRKNDATEKKKSMKKVPMKFERTETCRTFIQKLPCS